MKDEMKKLYQLTVWASTRKDEVIPAFEVDYLPIRIANMNTARARAAIVEVVELENEKDDYDSEMKSFSAVITDVQTQKFYYVHNKDQCRTYREKLLYQLMSADEAYYAQIDNISIERIIRKEADGNNNQDR